jgi:hypothetical protein
MLPASSRWNSVSSCSVPRCFKGADGCSERCWVLVSIYSWEVAIVSPWHLVLAFEPFDFAAAEYWARLVIFRGSALIYFRSSCTHYLEKFDLDLIIMASTFESYSGSLCLLRHFGLPGLLK